MIPVTVLTGFLGSGKTTLLRSILRDRQMRRTAVIINEFGEIGIDHDLVETSDESFVQLSNGCLCCQVRSDLVQTLEDLADRRERGSVPNYERVVIETSGLADPAPVIHALVTDRRLRRRYVLDAVVTTVDATTGLNTLERYPESVRQAALADCIVVTKTDLPQAEPAAVERRVRDFNPDCTILRVACGAVGAHRLFEAAEQGKSLQRIGADLDLRHPAASSAWTHHGGEVRSICVLRERPIHAATLALFVSALADNCGTDLIRMKGIVAVVEEPERPAVIHGVQHVYHAPVWLARWPSDDRRCRLVFIGRNLRESWCRWLLELLEQEVCDEIARRTGAAAVG